MITLEDDLLKTLRCKFCKGYLSVSPIVTLASGKNICGRCLQKQQEYGDGDDGMFQGPRNEVYETIIQLIKFPCQYDRRGCKEVLPFSQIWEHEQNCCFGLYNCPIILDKGPCTWIGQRDEIKQHFYEEHTDCISAYPCTFKPAIDENKDYNLLMTMCGFNFFVQIKFNCEFGKIWHRVRFLGEPYLAHLFSFCLEILGPNCSVQKLSPVQLKEQFILSECMVTDMESLQDILGSYEKLSFKIRIVMNNTKTCGICASLKDSELFKSNCDSNKFQEIFRHKCPSNEFYSIEEVSEETLDPFEETIEKFDETVVWKKLKCSCCQNYLSYGPVLLTNAGENICGRCHETMTDGDKKSFVRNEVYEMVAARLKFPCRFDREGCKDVLTWSEVAEHEKFCYYASYSCPVVVDGKICGWKGSRDRLKAHFVSCHPKLLVQHPCVFKPDICVNSEVNLLMSVYGYLFLVQIKFTCGQRKMWHRVYFLGERSMGQVFKYIVDMKSPIATLHKSRKVHLVENFSTEDCLETDIEGLEKVLGQYGDINMQVSIFMKNVGDSSSRGSETSQVDDRIKRIRINYPGKRKPGQEIEIKLTKNAKAILTAVPTCSSIPDQDDNQDITDVIQKIFEIPPKRTDTFRFLTQKSSREFELKLNAEEQGDK